VHRQQSGRRQGDGRPEGQSEKKRYAGVILIRFYEVLDQFGDLLECSGKDGLTEEIFPKDVKQGGTDVTNGVPAQPDRVYQIESEKHKPFKGKEYVQAIQIFGCPFATTSSRSRATASPRASSPSSGTTRS
jgi:hypothetical protein